MRVSLPRCMQLPIPPFIRTVLPVHVYVVPVPVNVAFRKLHVFYPQHKSIFSLLFFFPFFHGFLQPTANGTVKTPKDLSVGYLQTVGT